ncbi:MAG: cytochrome c [Acidobacteria bacterium]|nr:cytochrome c [Acidobacteriota bacterium]
MSNEHRGPAGPAVVSPRQGRIRRHHRRTVGAGCLLLILAGCRQDMHDAPRYDPLEASAVLPQGASAQPLVDGTVARGELRADDLLETGRVNGQLATVFPFAIAASDLDRGEERFNIYCSPCHGRDGEGNGMVVQRGYRQAASLHTDRLRQAQPGYLYEVIRNGFGVMPDYRAQITVDDRWRIVAYIRALQLSRNATPADVPASELATLDAPAAPAPAAGSTSPSGGHD